MHPTNSGVPYKDIVVLLPKAAGQSLRMGDGQSKK